MCILKPFNIDCECPPTISFNGLPVKPSVRSPLDKLGYPQTCCCCIPLRAAVIIICILSFMWAAVEVQCGDKRMAAMFPSRNDIFYYCKLVYIMWSVLYVIACGLLMLGIIVRRWELLNIYIWYSFLFCCMYFVIMVGTIAMAVVNSGNISKKATAMFILSVVWTCLFIYFLMIVNTYKLVLWFNNLIE